MIFEDVKPYDRYEKTCAPIRMKDHRPYMWHAARKPRVRKGPVVVRPEDLEIFEVGGPNYRFNVMSLILLAGRHAQLAKNLSPKVPALTGSHYFKVGGPLGYHEDWADVEPE